MKSKLKLTAAALAEKAAQTAEAAALARAAALEAGAAVDAEAGERRKKFMTQWLAEFDDGAMDAEQRAAMATLEEAAQAATKTDPMMKAALEVHRLSIRRFAAGQMAANFASQVGVPAPRSDPDRDPVRTAEAGQLAVRHLAERLEGERTAAIFAALEAAADGDA